MNNIESFLTSVEKRLEAASPGPWAVNGDHFPVCSTGNSSEDGEDYGVCGNGYAMRDGVGNSDAKTDAEFIAHSRTDLEKAVKALRIACQALKDIQLGWEKTEPTVSGRSVAMQTGWRIDRALREIDLVLDVYPEREGKK